MVGCLSACGTSQVSVTEGTTPAEKQAETPAAASPESNEHPTSAAEPAQETEAPSADQEQAAPSGGNAPEGNVDIENAPRLDLIYCEVKIDQNSALYNAQAAGPTLEEALDNAVEEACAVPCAEDLAHAQISEDEADKKLTSCTEHCVSDTIVLAVSCTSGGQVIYTDGAWNQGTDDNQDSSQNTQEQE